MYMFNGTFEIITSLSAARSEGGYKNVLAFMNMVSLPFNNELEAAVGGHITFLQTYTPTVKAMEDRVPLDVRPNLLTYLLGRVYVSTKSKFQKVWEEVVTQRTKFEILEVLQPSVQWILGLSGGEHLNTGQKSTIYFT